MSWKPFVGALRVKARPGELTHTWKRALRGQAGNRRVKRRQRARKPCY